MRIEATGKIKGVGENITAVDQDLEYKAEYTVRIVLEKLGREAFLTLKRMEHLGETVWLKVECAQLEFPDELPEAFQEILPTPSLS